MMVGAVLFLVLAGLIEGSFSQFSAKTVPYTLKIAVAVLLFAPCSPICSCRAAGRLGT